MDALNLRENSIDSDYDVLFDAWKMCKMLMHLCANCYEHCVLYFVCASIGIALTEKLFKFTHKEECVWKI